MRMQRAGATTLIALGPPAGRQAGQRRHSLQHGQRVPSPDGRARPREPGRGAGEDRRAERRSRGIRDPGGPELRNRC